MRLYELFLFYFPALSPMRIHVIGQANLPALKKYSSNPFTQKIINFIKMMKPLYPIYFYGVEGSQVDATQSISVVPHALWNTYYGQFDWINFYYKKDPTDIVHQTFIANTIQEIRSNYQEGDIIVFFDGIENKKIIERLPSHFVHVEAGIGYSAKPWARFRIFESYAILHAHLGQLGLMGYIEGQLDWVVIANFLDPDELYPTANPKRENYLFMGRLIQNKGLEIAIEVTRALNEKLVVAGVYNPANQGFKSFPSHVEFIGHADQTQRRHFMQNAKALFAPTLYTEPFGNVVAESLLCGTPVITTDHGAFTENVKNGFNGFRCRTMVEFVQAAKQWDQFEQDVLVNYAKSKFSLQAIAPRMAAYLEECVRHHPINVPAGSKLPTDYYLPGWNN